MLLILFLIEQKGVSEDGSKRLFYISAFLTFFIMAFRGDNVGADMIEYVHFWQGKDDLYGTWDNPTLSLAYEPGLSWFCYFLHIFNDGDAWIFIFLTSCITFVPFLYLVWRDAEYKVLPILFYTILWGLLDISYAGVRQVMGVGLCISAFIVWRRHFDYRGVKILLIVLLLGFALTFHTSVYFTIPFYILFLLLKNTNIKICVITLILSLVFGIVFAKIAPYLFDIVGSFFTSVEILFRLNHYFEGNGIDDGLKNTVIGMKQILTVIAVCIIVSLSRKEKNNKFYINCLTVGCSMFNIFVSFPNTARFLYPFLLLGIIASPSKIRFQKHKILKLFFILIIVVLSIHEIQTIELGYIDKKSDYYVFNQMFPYNFVWE